jgi:replicative DNA helicase
MNPIPYDRDAEEAFIGGCLVRPARIPEHVHALLPEDFYTPKAQALWGAILDLHGAGQTIDPVTVHDAVRRRGSKVAPDEIVHLMTQAITPRAEHVEIIRRHRFNRDLQALANEMLELVDKGEAPAEVVDRLQTGLARATRPIATSAQNVPLEEVIANAESLAPWVIPGLLRADWRAIVVAAEGRGKSTLLRQFAVCASQGIHPLNFNSIPPVVTLIVDLENPVAAIAETGAAMLEQAKLIVGDRFVSGRCALWTKPGGVDLRTLAGAGQLEREIEDVRPQLVVLGPLYKATTRHRGDEFEQMAEGVQEILDDLRTRYRFALLMEHHAPQGSQGGRDIRPYGSQRWLAWPELGIALRGRPGGEYMDLGRWRGDRLQSAWPTRITKGGEWPWSGYWKPFSDELEESF